MFSIVLALAAAVSWGASDFLGGLFTRRVALAPVLLISQAAGFIMLVLIAAPRGGPLLDLQAIAFAMGASAAGLVGVAALYRGMATGVVSIVAPISAAGAALPVIFGLLRGERASSLQTLGIVLALIGIVLASLSNERSASKGPILARGVGLAIVAALGFGGFFIMLHEASTLDVLWAGAVQRLTGICIVGAIVLAMRLRIAVPRTRLPGLVTVGVLDTGANVLYAYASTSGLVSVAAVLASLYPVMTVVLARFVLQERISRPQTLGVVVALTGVALIAGGAQP